MTGTVASCSPRWLRPPDRDGGQVVEAAVPRSAGHDEVEGPVRGPALDVEGGDVHRGDERRRGAPRGHGPGRRRELAAVADRRGQRAGVDAALELDLVPAGP